ncbi:hypothetical protein [Methylocapsa sp. S129]|uniref:hypothetical protein n=1 Tax=Methylocapsa sp. S129 TaxID=1641869 RepID=UPI00131B929D|nr:hypothetical protein [Methylocapsa sp. S129]
MRAMFLRGRRIGISISESPDMAALGLGKEHLDDAMTEIARHLIACGATLAYGGDLREGGFTELLFEIVTRYRRNKDSNRILVKNYLAWPVHTSLLADQIEKWQMALEGLAELVLLSPDGKKMKLSNRPADAAPLGQGDWEDGLTAMRNAMACDIDARIVLGGQTAKYKGRLPGIAEEALIQIERGAPLFVLGGFGGCSSDIARAMGIDQRDDLGAGSTRSWTGIETVRQFSPNNLHNGLTAVENRKLAETVHIDEATALILRGLMRMKPGPTKRRRTDRSG